MAVNTYYFNSSDSGPTDSNNVWSNDTNIDDNNISTYANSNSAPTNYPTINDNYLETAGTNSPSPSETITQVRVRSYGYGTSGLGSSRYGIEILTSSDEVLANYIDLNTSGSGAYTSYTTLSTPTGGWTWSKIQALKARAYIESSSGFGAYISVIEIEVTDQIPTASVSPITNTLSTLVVNPIWVFQANASVGPVSSTLSVVNQTATYIEKIASVSPLITNLSLPEVITTYVAVLNASVLPEELSLVLPTVSATYKEYIADVSPISTSFSIPEVTPILVFNGFVSPLTISIYLSEVSATYRNDWKTFGLIETAWATTVDPSTTWGAGSSLETSWADNLYNRNVITLYDQDISYDTAFIAYDGFYILANSTWTESSTLETAWAES